MDKVPFSMIFLPNHNNRKVKYIPSISQVSVLMLDESLCNNFHKALSCENEEESIFYFFLNIMK